MCLLAWTADKLDPVMLATSGAGEKIELRLPEGGSENFTLNISVHIRDFLYCVTEYDLGSVQVERDMKDFWDWIADDRSQLGYSDPNIKGQRFTSYSLMMGEVTDELLRESFIDGDQLSLYSIADLGSHAIQLEDNSTFNESLIENFRRNLNQFAEIRERLILNLTNLSTINIDAIKHQASILAQLTKSTNQLTRVATVRFPILLSSR